MKKYSYFSSLLFVLFLAGCDIIEDPVIRLNNQYLEGVYGPAPEFNTLENPVKNVLFEEFTGHLCGFCPPANAWVHEKDEELGSRLVAVSVHAGTLAAVQKPPSHFTADFNTSIGTIYWQQLNGGFNPCARINRNGGNSNFYGFGLFEPNLNNALNEDAQLAMQMVTQYVAEDEILNIHVHSQFLESLEGPYDIIVLLVENHIISAQLDYNLDPSEIEEYEHNAVLRAGVTGALGEPLITDPIQFDQVVKSYSFPMQDGWEPANCVAVAFVINRETEEVLNAVEANVNP